MSSLETRPDATRYKAPHGNIPNTPLSSSMISFCLGIVFALGASLAVSSQSWWQLGFFIASWSIFHWAEFGVTAGWNRPKCSVDSYLLDNGSIYHIANGTGLAEYLIGSLFYHKNVPTVSIVGAVMVVFGQALRSVAMIHASTNFSHSLEFRKREEHRLVTDGVYAWCRHPSYAGFYYWALGTQVLLQNPITFAVYLVLLWRFFSRRIQVEEKELIKFFGQDYVNYRSRVGVWIPFA